MPKRSDEARRNRKASTSGADQQNADAGRGMPQHRDIRPGSRQPLRQQTRSWRRSKDTAQSAMVKPCADRNGSSCATHSTTAFAQLRVSGFAAVRKLEVDEALARPHGHSGRTPRDRRRSRARPPPRSSARPWRRSRARRRPTGYHSMRAVLARAAEQREIGSHQAGKRR